MRIIAIACISVMLLQLPSLALAISSVSEAQSVVKRGATIATNVQSMLKAAQKEGDMIMVDCLNKKLSQISANLKGASERLEQLNGANPASQRHHMTVIEVLGQKLQTLDQEARQCVGQGMYDTGNVKVVTETDLSKLPSKDVFFRPPDIFKPIIVPPSSSTPPPASGVK